jgi:hypothetical protein
VVHNVIAKSRIQLRIFCGLEAQIWANRLHGILFTVSILWKQFEEVLFQKKFFLFEK